MSRKDTVYNPYQTIYPDVGCDKAKAKGYDGGCLNCPLHRCLEDGPEVILNRIKTPKELSARNREIIKLRAEGMALKDLAKKFKLTKSMICQVTK